MRHFTLIYLREVKVRLRDWRFWIGFLLLPLIGGLSLLLPRLLERSTKPLLVYVIGGESHLVQTSLPEITFVPVSAASLDSLKGHLGPYQALLVAGDSGKDFKIFSSEELSLTQEEALRRLIYQVKTLEKARALGLSAEALARLQEPPEVHFYVVGKNAESHKGLLMLLSSLTSSLLYLLIMMTGYAILLSTLEEKTNRLVEYLLIYVKPEQLLTAKVLAMLSLTMLQLAGWAALGLLALTPMPESLLNTFTGALRGMPWFETGLFVLAGVLLYTFLYAAAGATSESVTELSGLAQTIQWPLLLGFFAILTLSSDPAHPLLRFLSHFPLTAPLAMPIRLIASKVEFVEKAFSLLLLLLTTGLVGYLAARVYRGALLLYGQKLNWKAIWQLLRT